MFLRLWRRPDAFDARRGELGPYLRLMARSRALDLWREGQAAGRASDRVKVVVAGAEGRAEDAPGARGGARRRPRAACARRSRGCPTAQREALVLAYWGGLTAGRDRAGAPMCRSAPPRAASGSGLAKLREECAGVLDATATEASEALLSPRDRVAAIPLRLVR